MAEAKLVTTDAFSNYINTFKSKIFDWNNPWGAGVIDQNTQTSVDKTKAGNGVEGIVFATKKDIDVLFSV